MLSCETEQMKKLDTCIYIRTQENHPTHHIPEKISYPNKSSGTGVLDQTLPSG